MSKSSYKNLIARQKRMALGARIYDITEGFPSDEKYGLISQLRRAAVSVPSNVAEGKPIIRIVILQGIFGMRVVRSPRSGHRS